MPLPVIAAIPGIPYAPPPANGFTNHFPLFLASYQPGLKETNIQRDQALFRRIARGDSQAFAEFYDAYAVRLGIYVSRFLKSDIWAEEIVQDTFIKLWAVRETVAIVEYPAGFVYRMAANRTKDHLKHRAHEVKLQQQLASLLATEERNTTQDRFDYRQGEKLFREAVQQLPAQRGRIFKMRHEEGLSYDEIAGKLNISRNTVRNLLNLAIQHIRTYLLEKGGIKGIWVLFFFLQ